MASSPRESNEATPYDTGTGPVTNRRPPTPRWVKVFGVIGILVLVLILVILIANLAGFGGEHGPGRHTQPAGDPTTSAGNHMPPSSHHPLLSEEHENMDGIAERAIAFDTTAFDPGRMALGR